ncbi:MAG: hypothetical protein K0R71_699 [Bacillales bacterium]|jgi:hypothetical protein|nr:hypothetical protein [Bacillales bacterium]
MLKTRTDFASQSDYKKYTRSSEFMHTYKVYGKTAAEIQQDMCFPCNWMHFLEAAVKFVNDNPAAREYTAFDMFELVDEIMEYMFKG